jgi:hypothetical protein
MHPHKSESIQKHKHVSWDEIIADAEREILRAECRIKRLNGVKEMAKRKKAAGEVGPKNASK